MSKEKREVSMKIYALLAIGFFVSQFGGIMAMARSPLKGMELKLVREWKFDTEIQDVAWGETGMDRLYLKIIAFKDKVKLYNNEENVIGQLPLSKGEKVSISPKGTYFGITKVVESPVEEKGEAKVCFTLYDSELQKKAIIKYRVGYDGEGGRIFCISDVDGSFVEVEYGPQTLRFRNINGKLKKEIDLFEKDEYSQWGVVTQCSKSGEFFGVMGCNIYYDSTGSPHHDFYVVLFDKDGTEIWRNLIQSGQKYMSTSSDALSISSNGNYILAAKAFDPSRNDRGLILFDRNGNFVREYQGIFGEFSCDERYIAICGRNKVQLVETHNGDILWTQEFPWNIDALQREKGWRWLNDVRVSKDGSLIAVASVAYRIISYKTQYGDTVSERVSEKPEIRLINKSGETIFKKVMPIVRKVLLSLSSDGTQISIRGENTLQVFRSSCK